MKNVNVTIRMDEKLRDEASKLFDDLGMGLNQAINIFVRQAVREQKIPFTISKIDFNYEISKILLEIEEIRKNPKYSSNNIEINSLINDIDKIDSLSKKYFKY